jgi:hypothetical protein
VRLCVLPHLKLPSSCARSHDPTTTTPQHSSEPTRDSAQLSIPAHISTECSRASCRLARHTRELVATLRRPNTQLRVVYLVCSASLPTRLTGPPPSPLASASAYSRPCSRHVVDSVHSHIATSAVRESALVFQLPARPGLANAYTKRTGRGSTCIASSHAYCRHDFRPGPRLAMGQRSCFYGLRPLRTR